MASIGWKHSSVKTLTLLQLMIFFSLPSLTAPYSLLLLKCHLTLDDVSHDQPKGLDRSCQLERDYYAPSWHQITDDQPEEHWTKKLKDKEELNSTCSTSG